RRRLDRKHRARRGQPLAVPRLQQAAEPIAVTGGGAGEQRNAGGYALGFRVVAEEDDFHPWLEILLAIFQAAAGDIAAGASGTRAVRCAGGGITTDRLSVEPRYAAHQNRNGEQSGRSEER